MSAGSKPSLNPMTRYYQAQLNLLNDIEGKHRTKPNVLTVLFALGATLIEAAISFTLLLSDGQIVAIVGALFPVMLLWTIAAYQANHVNLPKQYDELIEQYENELDV